MPAVPSPDANLVEFTGVWWTLPCEPKVCCDILVIVITVESFILLICRMVHGFTCAGVLPSQYTNLTKFAGLGTVGQSYIRRGIGHVLKSGSQDLPLALTIVYQGRGYMDLVSRAAEQSMQSAVEEVQARPDYAEKGEVRHVRVHACFTVV